MASFELKKRLTLTVAHAVEKDQSSIPKGSSMRLIPLQTGTLAIHMGAVAGVDEMTDFPIPSWLIEHPEGVVL